MISASFLEAKWNGRLDGKAGLSRLPLCSIMQLHNKFSLRTMMPRQSQHPKEESFNFRIDPKLKAEFQTATEAEDKPAAQVLRDFMRAYVERQRERVFAAEAKRQSRMLAERAADPGSDDAEVMRWIEDVADTDGWTA